MERTLGKTAGPPMLAQIRAQYQKLLDQALRENAVQLLKMQRESPAGVTFSLTLQAVPNPTTPPATEKAEPTAA